MLRAAALWVTGRRPSRGEQPVRLDERQFRPALASPDLSVEARATAGVAGRTGLLDPDPDGILIAIHPHLDHALPMTGGFAFAPQRIARAAEVPGFSARNGLAQGLLIHVRDHQHFAAASVGSNAVDKAGGVEFGLELQPFLTIVDFC